MKLNVAQLRRTIGGTEKYTASEVFPPIRIGADTYAFISPVEVRVAIANAGKSLLVKGNINCEIEAVCSKCLKNFPYKLSFDFEDEFIPAENALNQDDEAFIFEKDEFSIDERIQEHILLHLPMRLVCSDTCEGLCPKCGTDRNINSCRCVDGDIDPRLQILSEWNKGV